MAIDGKWNIVVNSPMGAQKSEVTFKSDGGKLTGTGVAQGSSQELADGKVDGDNVSWSNSITTPFPMTLEFSGAVVGDTLNGSVKAGSFGSFPFTGARG